MSGHSHWASIKHQKGAADAKKSKVFSKISRQISVAAKEGGKDPETNSKLRMAVDQAKEINMPKDNIEKAIKRGTGELEGQKLEAVTFEAYGPGKTALIIEGITDNKNRALGEIKKILAAHKSKLADEGSVRWMFEKKGVISLPPQEKEKDDLELEAIDAGAEDISWDNDCLVVSVSPDNLEKTKQSLSEKGIEIESASLDWTPKETVSPEEKEKEECQKLFEALDESETVQDIYSNLKE
jgi:YebC/PmpR family DNA-binding regulatory protein